MRVLKDISDMRTRLTRLKSKYRVRDNMVALCDELYMMKWARKSGFHASNTTTWRNSTPSSYQESSNKPQNIVDIMTAVLGGYPPQYKCFAPGNVETTTPSRAEMFLDGAWRLNSRRQQVNLTAEVTYKTILHGAVGIRVYWMPNPPPVIPTLQDKPQAEEDEPPVQAAQPLPQAQPPLPGMPGQPSPIPGMPEQPPQMSGMPGQPPPMPAMPGMPGVPGPGPAPPTQPAPEPAKEQVVVQPHNADTFPICIEVIDITKLYPGGPGLYGKPFAEIFYVQKRTAGEVIDEWEGQKGVQVSHLTKGIEAEDLYVQEEEYIEWWGQTPDGKVHYAIAFRDKWIMPPQSIDYPGIPFVVTTFKRGDTKDASLQRLPFLYSVFNSVEKLDYVRARSFRQIDMFGNMNPYHSGDTPLPELNVEWGNIIELDPKEEIKFPQWPGNPPDIYREMQQIEGAISEGSFSPAMFGQMSARMSGYGMSQLFGTDTLRTETPRYNLELAYSSVADLIFGLMQRYSAGRFMAVVSQTKGRKMAAMLSGEETKSLIVETYVKPKNTQDDIRLATIGTQIASMPSPPVSMRYILENFFMIQQPEEEIARRLDEDVMKDPLIRMMAMYKVLVENNNPFAAIVAKQIADATAAQAQGQPPPGGQPPIPEMGMGLPQATGGNPPIVPPGGNVVEEVGPTQQTARLGGPPPEMGGM